VIHGEALSDCVAELVFLRNRVILQPIVITRDWSPAVLSPSLAPATTSIKTTEPAAASYPAIIA
jgi:hypothetical protein